MHLCLFAIMLSPGRVLRWEFLAVDEGLELAVDQDVRCGREKSGVMPFEVNIVSGSYGVEGMAVCTLLMWSSRA